MEFPNTTWYTTNAWWLILAVVVVGMILWWINSNRLAKRHEERLIATRRALVNAEPPVGGAAYEGQDLWPESGPQAKGQQYEPVRVKPLANPRIRRSHIKRKRK